MKNVIGNNIEETTNELIRMISSLGEEQLNKIPFEGSWTVGQVSDHLLISYGLIEALNNGHVRTTESLPGKEIEQIKKIFLDFGAKYKSAEALLPANDPIEKRKLLNDLEKRISQMKEVIKTKDLTETCIGIPFKGIGELTRIEWLYVILYHTQRHIHQIEGILKSVQSQIV